MIFEFSSARWEQQHLWNQSEGHAAATWQSVDEKLQVHPQVEGKLQNVRWRTAGITDTDTVQQVAVETPRSPQLDAAFQLTESFSS